MTPLQVLRRHDGFFIIYDERLPPGRRTLKASKSLREMLEVAQRIYDREIEGK